LGVAKQLVSLVGRSYMLAYTYNLYKRSVDQSELYVLTLADLQPLVEEHLPKVPKSHIITVPARRNILPHTLFALNWLNTAPDEPVMFVACDNMPANKATFRASLSKFIAWCGPTTTDTLLLCDAAENKGQKGYVKLGSQNRVVSFRDSLAYIPAHSRPAWHQFPHIYVVSKRGLSTALDAIEDKKLARQAKTLLSSPKKHLNRLHVAMPFVGNIFAFPTPDKPYKCTPNTRAYLARLEMTDIGTYEAIYRIAPKDDRGNVIIGSVILDESSRGNLLINYTDKPLAVIRTANSAVIYTTEGCLTSPLSNADKIGALYKTWLNLPR
jgi:hypothetical protein